MTLMYNLIGYSSNRIKTPGNLYQYRRDGANENLRDWHFKISFSQANLCKGTQKVQVAPSLKHFSNF